PEQLDTQLAFVTRWFRPVGLPEVLAFARGGGRLPNDPVLVTFDDGYRDNHDVARPILERHGVRATFFVATDYVDRRRLYWWDRIALVVKRSSRDALEIDYPARVRLPLDGAAARREAVRRLQRIVKDCVGLDLERFLDGLEQGAGVSLAAEEVRRLVDDTIMTWEHVVALRRAGMDVQSHTQTHRVLQTLEPSELAGELRGSRDLLERVLGEPVRAISYPVGRSLKAAPVVRRAVADAGYELGFSNGTGVDRLRRFDPFDARRVSMDAAMSDAFFRAMLAIPTLAY
ncbi:MAG TPA: polysaccharide deacetylase family protein, partial [Polyangiaceae bacterium]|nr:polysaccharide deacetylase family protein [Polyangiaceae bacterium]